MFKDVIVGQYIDRDSFIHRMDPKMKIIISFLYMILLFCINSVVSYGIVSIFTFAILLSCGVRMRLIFRGIKPMVFILVFTALMNLLMTPGDKLFSLNVFGLIELSVSQQGVRMGILMVIRLLYLLLVTSVLTLTTTPLKLTDGIERLLRPLSVIRVPAHEIAMMMTIALRFIPTLADETDKIIKAQKARGADFETGGIIKRAKALIPILVPLFVSAFRRADELATAMEARCYRGGNGRTKMTESHTGKHDFAALGLFFIVIIFVLLTELYM